MLNDLMRYSICNSGLTFVDIERVELFPLAFVSSMIVIVVIIIWPAVQNTTTAPQPLVCSSFLLHLK